MTTNFSKQGQGCYYYTILLLILYYTTYFKRKWQSTSVNKDRAAITTETHFLVSFADRLNMRLPTLWRGRDNSAKINIGVMAVCFCPQTRFIRRYVQENKEIKVYFLLLITQKRARERDRHRPKRIWCLEMMTFFNHLFRVTHAYWFCRQEYFRHNDLQTLNALT
jgi:hypothetical protein